MFGCRRLDEDLKFPWFESVSHRWQISRRTRPLSFLFFVFFLFLFFVSFFLVNALFLVR